MSSSSSSSSSSICRAAGSVKAGSSGVQQWQQGGSGSGGSGSGQGRRGSPSAATAGGGGGPLGRAGRPTWGRASVSVAWSRCATTHPLYTILANIFGTSLSETTMRPNPTRAIKQSHAGGHNRHVCVCGGVNLLGAAARFLPGRSPIPPTPFHLPSRGSWACRARPATDRSRLMRSSVWCTSRAKPPIPPYAPAVGQMSRDSQGWPRIFKFASSLTENPY